MNAARLSRNQNRACRGSTRQKVSEPPRRRKLSSRPTPKNPAKREPEASGEIPTARPFTIQLRGVLPDLRSRAREHGTNSPGAVVLKDGLWVEFPESAPQRKHSRDLSTPQRIPLSRDSLATVEMTITLYGRALG